MCSIHAVFGNTLKGNKQKGIQAIQSRRGLNAQGHWSNHLFLFIGELINTKSGC